MVKARRSLQQTVPILTNDAMHFGPSSWLQVSTLLCYQGHEMPVATESWRVYGSHPQVVFGSWCGGKKSISYSSTEKHSSPTIDNLIFRMIIFLLHAALNIQVTIVLNLYRSKDPCLCRHAHRLGHHPCSSHLGLLGKNRTRPLQLRLPRLPPCERSQWCPRIA